jgi:hypothetical protein
MCMSKILKNIPPRVARNKWVYKVTGYISNVQKLILLLDSSNEQLDTEINIITTSTKNLKILRDAFNKPCNKPKPEIYVTLKKIKSHLKNQWGYMFIVQKIQYKVVKSLCIDNIPSVQFLSSLYKWMSLSQAQWCRPVTPALRRLSKEDHKFEASLGYLVRPCLRKTTITTTNSQVNS